MTTHLRALPARLRIAVIATLVVATTIASASMHPASAAGTDFRDVPGSHQFHDEITWLAKMEVTGGYADNTFKPRDAVTREAFAAFLYRLAGSPIVTRPARSPFTDVPSSAKFYNEIVWLDRQGITNGWSDGTFRPKQPITREAIAAFLYRLSGRPAVSLPARSPFKDVSTGSQFYREISWLARTGITTGYADGTFKPRWNVQRQAIAAFLYRGSEGLRGSGNAAYKVGEQIFPGTYVAYPENAGDFACFWERRTDAGTSSAGILGENYAPGRTVATILPDDPYFAPRTCGPWAPLRATSPSATSFGDGTSAVGYHLRAGTYSAPGGSSCYWELYPDATGSDTVVDYADGTNGPQQVQVRNGQMIATLACGTWTRIGN